LQPRRPLAERERRDHDREHDVRLQEQCGDARLQAERHRGVEQGELAEAHEEADADDGLPARERARHDDDRKGDDGEADGDEEERRDAGHAPVDDDEVEAPHRRHEGGQQHVSSRHPPSSARSIRKHQRWFVWMIR